jgi:sugar phosphate isomerase/epimerase
VEIGLLTAPFAERTLESVVEFAKRNSFQALEVEAGPGSKHVDPADLTEKRAGEVRELVSGSGLRISSLAWYANLLEPDTGKREEMCAHMRAVIDGAVALGVEVVCTMAGMPMPGKDRMATIEQDFPVVFAPLVEYAGERGVKIAFENWFATNIRNLAHWQRVFEVVPAPNLGLNFDPSHLLWQGIDYLEAVERFKDRIFHTHAKDTEIKQHMLRWVGNQSPGWWRYCTPGYGEIDWPVYIARLRQVGYDGVLSIENEDAVFGVEEGFIKGQQYLARHI